jgi:hypothetical protein
VAVVVLVAGIGAAAWWTVSRPASRVNIEVCSGTFGGINITYLGNQSGFLTTGYLPEPLYCYSEVLPLGSTISLGFGLHSYDLNNSHVIQSFSVLPPYSLASYSPTLPAVVAPGGNLSFTVSVHVPTAPGTYSGPGASLSVM